MPYAVRPASSWPQTVTLDVGAMAPEFELRNQRREKVSLADLKGSKVALVFIPFAFTSTCEGELCEIRDNFDVFEGSGTRVVAITCDTSATNARWAQENGFEFDILSDFWPHGEVSRRYDTFNEMFGYAERTTYFIDEGGTITDVVRSDQLKQARPFAHYEAALKP